MAVVELKPGVMRAVKPKSRMTPIMGETVRALFDNGPSEISDVFYFSANWCGPCREFTPVVTKISNEFTGVAFYKLDVDDFVAGGIALSLGLTTIPALYMRTPNGQFYMTGAKSIEDVREWITNNL